MQNERVAIDTVAAVDLLHPERTSPPPLDTAAALFLPLPVLGELHYGALNAPPEWQALMLETLQQLISRCRIVAADTSTTPFYAAVRRQIEFPKNISRRRESHLLNDLWIAAMCLEHDLPLLTNDGDFDRIEGLRVIHW